VTVTGANVVPEFPAGMLAAALAMSAAAIALTRRIWGRPGSLQ
jgi:hypothetical protein